MSERVLVVDDEANMRWVLAEALKTAGYEVTGVSSGPEALHHMTTGAVDLVILDLKLKGMDGLGVLRHLRERWPEVVVIMLTAYGTVATAVEAMQLGAADYLRKPFDVEEVTFKLQRALERKRLQAEVRRLRQQVRHGPPRALVGADPAWQRCVEQVQSFTALDLDIVLVGAAGTGKTALGRLAHAMSERRDRPLLELDVRAVAPAHVPALLGGRDANEGVWVKAGSGTVVLKHVEQLGSDGWAALRWKYRERSGAGGPRLIMTTADAGSATDLVGAEIPVPALSERRGDIAPLARAVAAPATLSAAALELLVRWTWPGNVAELRSVVAQAVGAAPNGLVEERHLPSYLLHVPRHAVPVVLPPEGLSLEAVERSLISQALELAGGNKTRAAELLGLTRHTLLYRLEKYSRGS